MQRRNRDVGLVIEETLEMVVKKVILDTERVLSGNSV